MKNLVWIASYPKSGNTWVRFMACNLLFGPQDSAAALNVCAPDIHELGALLGAHSGLVKTHFLFSSRVPLVERTAAAIYVVRDPADVLASNFHYAQRSAALLSDTQEVFDRYLDTFLQHGGDPRWIAQGMGSWEENVRSWLVASQSFPVLFVRYEDLSRDPRTICQQIARMLRPDASAQDIEAAVASSSFERMQAIENADIRAKRVGIFYKPYLQPSIDSGSRFMRRGAVGEGMARLSLEQRKRLRAAFAPLLRELGYAAE